MVVVTGSTGLIGSALCASLARQGVDTLRLVRRPTGAAGEAAWNPEAARLDPPWLRDAQAVVHLSGEPISSRWTADKKRRIRESRVNSTRLLAEAIAQHASPSCAFVCASAVGIYGNRSDEILTEDSAPGHGFLADVCRAWELAAEPARAAGYRVVYARIGMVISWAGGAVAAMRRIFRWGLGGPVGSGRQFVSWIGLADLVRVLSQCTTNDRLRGPVNAVAQHPVKQAEFAATLGRVLRRPAVLRTPAFAVRMLLGEMGSALLLEGQRVMPRKLLDCGFKFHDPELEGALRAPAGQLE